MAALGEFELINRFFKRPARRHPMGVGDDCALLSLPAGAHLAVSSDMLVAGRHFLSTVPPKALGHKALAVNLSDLAACGADPTAFTLALSLPEVDAPWLESFASGLFELADAHECELLGGDTTKGPLNVCITVMGTVPVGQALLRSGAKPGDELWVSGTLGDARLALEAFRGQVSLAQEDFTVVRRAMEWPQARVGLGRALRGIATSALDVSDGLLGDLSHVLRASGVGAEVWVDALPRSAALARQTRDLQQVCVLTGGDDYELLFTAPVSRHDLVRSAGVRAGIAVTPIGRICEGSDLHVMGPDGQVLTGNWQAFDHFISP